MFVFGFATLLLNRGVSCVEFALAVVVLLPRDRVDWGYRNHQRRDVIHLRSFLADDDEIEGVGYRRSGKVLPADERYFTHWNHNPYRLDSGGGGHTLGDGAVFLLPYYMGLYHQFIEE